MDRRVLLLGAGRQTTRRPRASDISADAAGRLMADLTHSVVEALQKIGEQAYDAVVCWAEAEDELSAVIRIRKSKPSLPILVVSSREEPEFGELALRMGANRILRKNRVSRILGLVALALETGGLARENRDWVRENASRAGEILALARQTESLVRQMLSRNPHSPRVPFLPLVVDDDPLHALLMTNAFAQLGIAAPLPALMTGEEAISFLSGEGRYSDRSAFPMPSVVVCDVDLPGASGLDVLDWIRKRPELRELRVVLLTSSQNPAHVDRAYTSGADAFLTKPTAFTALVELVAGLERRWGKPRS